MMPGAGTKESKEPPHWMVIWPFDSASTGIPTKPNAGGTYIMFAGTPYAHLMVYQDPKMRSSNRCHPERSEGGHTEHGPLRCAQGDRKLFRPDRDHWIDPCRPERRQCAGAEPNE